MGSRFRISLVCQRKRYPAKHGQMVGLHGVSGVCHTQRLQCNVLTKQYLSRVDTERSLHAVSINLCMQSESALENLKPKIWTERDELGGKTMNWNQEMMDRIYAASGFIALGCLLSMPGVAWGQSQGSAVPSRTREQQAYNPTAQVTSHSKLGRIHAGRIARATPAFQTPEQKARTDEENLLNTAALAAMDADQYAEAEDNAQQSIALGDCGGIAEEVLAAALNAQGKTQQALQAYKSMADEGDVFPRNQLPYALLLLKTGHWAQAVNAYNKQLPYLANGQLMATNSHFSPAVPQPKELETAIHIGLGLTEDWRGYNWKTASHEQTLTQFQQALALQPNSALANYYYGFRLQHIGRWRQAQVFFKKAAALGNADVKAAAQEEVK